MKSRYILFITVLAATLSACKEKGPSPREIQVAEWREELAAEKNNLHVTDSLITAIVPKINEATTQEGFEYEKTEYDDLGRFRPKGMDPGENVQKTYLRCAVDDYGRTQLIATYCGAKSFVVEQLRIAAGDGTSVSTLSIAPNDGSNYSYDIDGTHYQSVTFAFAGKITEGMTQDSTVLAHADTDNGALGFIAQHADDAKLCGYLISSKGNEMRVAIPEQARRGMAATYELGVMLRESIRLQQENKTASLKIQYLEELLAKQDSILNKKQKQ